MATKKEQLTRMSQKHDIEAHWKLAENFIPMAGEIIVYDSDEVYDYARFKCGDGVTKVNDLPFIFKIDKNYATKEYVNDAIANITIEVDNTLTKEGEAADAKAVGDAIANIKSIVDVTELPTENIDKDILYRLPGARTNPELYYVNTKGEFAPYLGALNAVMAFASDDGSGTPYDPLDKIEYILVDELPETGMQLILGEVAYVYIVKSTGIGYLPIEDEWISAGSVIFRKADCGWSEDIDNETVEGIYAVYSNSANSTYNIFDGKKWVTLITEIDKTLSKENCAADAKAVGDIINILYTGAEIWMCEGNEVFNLGDYIERFGGKVNIELVDELPTTLEPSSESTLTINAYVVNSTGIAYIDFEGSGVMTVGEVLAGTGGFDHGWSQDINSETAPGFYCVHKVADIKGLTKTVNNLFETVPGETTHVNNTLTWDGNIDGRTHWEQTVSDSGLSMTSQWVHVSDSIPTYEELTAGFEVMESNGLNRVYDPDEEFHWISITDDENCITLTFNETGIVLLPRIIKIPHTDSNGVVWEKSGIYFSKYNLTTAEGSDGGYIQSFTIPGYDFTITEPDKKVIKQELLPEIAAPIEVDSTLTQEGQAADAKAVGDKITALNIPNSLSDLSQDTTHRTVTDAEKTTWNAKSNFSGSYNDLTDKPTIPSIEGLATEAYVDNKVASIVDSSPETLDTLNELAKALGEDPNFATTVVTEIGKKVDKVDGKELSTNDFTDEYKEALDRLAGQYYSEGLAYVLKGNGEYEVSGIGTCEDTDIVIPSVYNDQHVTSIRDNAFYNCSNLTSIIIPNSITSIGSTAFWDCSNLTNITIPNSVTNVGSGAFQSCNALTSITLPDSITSISQYMFNNCSNLKSVTIPNGVTNIGSSAFSYCPNLASITIPPSVTSIGSAAFNGCNSLANITIPNGVTSIDEFVFGYCKSLMSVTIPDSVTSIGNYSFYFCSRLTSIIIPNRVTSIGNNAFQACSNLTSITIPKSVTSIGEQLFFGSNRLTIYCEAESQPESWTSNWNSTNRPVVWGVAPDFIGINEKLLNRATTEYVDNAVANVTVEVDTTLMQEGKAADSKAVGDRLTLLEASLGAYITDIDNIVGDGIETEEPSEPTPVLISFKIANTAYQAEDGMTWGEWVNSEYNTNGWTDDGEYIYNSFGADVTFVSTDGTLSGRVTPNETIISGTDYHTRDAG